MKLYVPTWLWITPTHDDVVAEVGLVVLQARLLVMIVIFLLVVVVVVVPLVIVVPLVVIVPVVCSINQ